MAFDIAAAAGTVGQAVGSIFTIGEQRRAAQKQFERQKELQERAHEMQYDMWQKTNYEAQREHMERAGLNPALMYGMSGGGGQTTGTVGAGQAQKADIHDIAGNVAQMRMISAQTKLAEAQAQKAEAEANKIAGIDTELANIQAEIARIDAEVAGKTKQEAINYIKDKADKMLAETVQAQIKQTIDERTYNERVQQIKAESIGAMLENQIKGTNVNLNKARIKEIAENITQRWEQLRLQGQSIEQSKQNMEKLTEAMLWGAGINAAGNIVGDIIGVATKSKGSITKTLEEYGEGWKEITRETRQR